jgi:hypothetical protein
LPEHIKLDADETAQLLDCLKRAEELGRETDNLDIVAMAGPLMDLLIDKWLRRKDG